MAQPDFAAACRCGQTTVQLTGAPIQTVTCYCESCRAAAQGFERDLGAPQTVTADGGVSYCLYRKDRVRITQGAQNLRDYQLKPGSPTHRVVAGCCGSPMFLDFTPGHWLSIFRGRLPEPAPEPEMRILTKGRPQGVALSDDIPTYETQPPRFILRLLAAWAAMSFRRPKITWR